MGMAAVTLAHDPGLLASGVQSGVFRSQGHGRNHLGLGHGSEEMVRRVYALLGAVHHRSEVVEFRIEQHLEALKDRLGSLGFVTQNVTAEGVRTGNEEPRDTEVSTGEDLPEWARRDSNARPLAPEASALSN